MSDPHASDPGPAGWPGPRPFVGRQEVDRALRQELGTAMERSGRAVILHGPDGSGRVALARRLLPTAQKGRVRIAIGDADDPDQPAWNQIAHQLTARRRALRAVGRSAAGWIGLIPVIGGVAEAIVDTYHAVRRRRGREPAGAAGTGSTVDQVRLLLAEAPMEPRLIILENLETGDPDEMAGAFALARNINRTRTLFIGTSTSVGGRLPDEVAKLRDEIVRARSGVAIEIPPLTPDEALEAIEEATGGSLPPEWREWLERRAPGTPRQLWDLLGRLVQEGILEAREGRPGVAGAGWRWTRAPGPGDDALVVLRDQEVAGLSAEETRILTAAARIGESFPVPELADRLGADEIELQERLDDLVRRGRLAFEETVEVDGDFIDRYRFPDARTAARWAATGVDDGGPAAGAS